MMKYTSKEIYTLSNFLSFSRLLLAVPLWILMNNLNYGSTRIIVLVLCLFGALTDILDGYFARRNNQVTEVGKIIDPLADKIAIAVVMIKLMVIGDIPVYFFIMVIARDFLILFGGIIVSKKLGRILPSNVLGKITVISIGIVIILVLLNINEFNPLFMTFYYLSIFLIFVSLIGYFIRAKEFLTKKNYGSI